jgi:hypothetical protein
MKEHLPFTPTPNPSSFMGSRIEKRIVGTLLPRYSGPIRHPLAFDRLPGSTGYTIYLAPMISHRDEEGFASYSSCPRHRAVVSTPPRRQCRVGQISASHAAFALRMRARPSDLHFRDHICVHCRYGPVTRNLPKGDLVADALLVINDPIISTLRMQIALLAVQHAIPAIYSNREYAEAGGLISYGTKHCRSLSASRHLCRANFKKGAKPDDLPVVQSTKFELVIKTARALGITVPSTLLARADEVIE